MKDETGSLLRARRMFKGLVSSAVTENTDVAFGVFANVLE
jgi:hypothetical protein